MKPSDIEEEVWEVWEAVAPLTTHPMARATLHDLLFWGRRGNVGSHAREAALAYIKRITQAESIAKVEATRRAFALIAQANLADLVDVAVDTALKEVEEVLADEDPKPGVTLRMLEILVDRGIADGRIDVLLERSREAYPGAWNSSTTIGLQRKRATDTSERRALDREEIRGWLNEAAASEPLAALTHLQRAAEMARDSGQSDLLEEATRALQATGRAGLPLQRISSSVELPREVVEAHIEELVGDDSWWDVVVRVLSQGAPSGNVDQNKEAVTKQSAEFPLQAILPSVLLGEDGLPRYRAETDEEREDVELARFETLSIQIQSGFAAEALARASKKYGSPSPSSIIDELKANPSLHEGAMEAIGRVVERYENGDFEGAAFTALPIIERLARDVLLALDAPLFRTQREKNPGQYPGLGILLHELSQRGLDPSWARYMRTLLTSPTGMNFRNQALHGFVDNVSRETATAVLIALFYLAFLDSSPEA